MAKKQTAKEWLNQQALDYSKPYSWRRKANLALGIILTREKEWADEGSKRRSNWWDQLAGKADGSCCVIDGIDIPRFEYAAKRQQRLRAHLQLVPTVKEPSMKKKTKGRPMRMYITVISDVIQMIRRCGRNPTSVMLRKGDKLVRPATNKRVMITATVIGVEDLTVAKDERRLKILLSSGKESSQLAASFFKEWRKVEVEEPVPLLTLFYNLQTQHDVLVGDLKQRLDTHARVFRIRFKQIEGELLKAGALKTTQGSSYLPPTQLELKLFSKRHR